MLFDGIRLVEGSELQNLVVDSGTSFPIPPTQGELFYRTDGANEGLYIYNDTTWVKLQDENIDVSDVNGAAPLASPNLTGTPTAPTATTGTNSTQIATTAFVTTAVNAVSSGSVASANKWTTPRNLSLTGDGSATFSAVDGTANVSANLILANVNVNTGTFNNVTVNAKGLVTGASNVSYQPLDGDLTSIAGITDTAGLLRKTAVNTWSLDTTQYAPLASPALTGTPTAPTASAGTNTTQLATTAFVTGAVNTAASGNVATASKWATPRNLTLTGDATGVLSSVDGSSDVSASLTLATVNSNVGTFGVSASVPTITVNGKGLITSVSHTAIAIDATQLTTGTLPNARVSASNVTQHQASLTILESQITDGSILARVGGNETISGTWSFNNPVTGADPTGPTHFATRQYVDNITTGLDFKKSVIAATTANITLSGTQTVDGVGLVAGDRVLVKNQTNATENGIYDVAAGSWVRSSDANNTPINEVSAGMYCFVEQGSVNADTGWVLTTDGTITLGTTNLTFVQFTGLGQITAGNGLTKSGSTISALTVSSSRITVGPSGLDLATVTDSGAGTFKKITVDSYGRVSGTTNVTTADISALVTTSNISEGTNLYYTDTRARTSLSVSGVGLSYNSGTGVITSNATSTNTASTIVARDSSGGFNSGSIASSGNLTAAGTIVAGGTTTYTGYSSPLVVNYTGGGTQFGFALKPSASAGVTNAITFLHSSSTSGSATQVAAIEHLGSDAGMNLSGSWKLGGNNFETQNNKNAANGYVGMSGGAIVFRNLGQTFTSLLQNGNTAARTYTFQDRDGTIADLTDVNLKANSAAPVFTGMVRRSVNAAVSAAGTTQGTATSIANDIIVVTTASASQGVILPASVPGVQIVIINTTAVAVNVYPPSGGQVDSLGTNIAFSLPTNGKIMFMATTNTQYYTLNATYA